MNIKNRLKKIGITLAELASKLKISRPTLDSYIDMFESNQVIPKEKYQKIFECLFSSNIDDRETFIKLLEHCNDLIERDTLLGTFELGVNKTDIITSVIDEMKKDMYSETWDEDIYIFINMLLRSYKREPIFKHLATYILTLNGKKDVELLDNEEKKYISNYYKVFYKDKNNLLMLDDEYLEKFLKRVHQMKKTEKENRDEMEKELIEKVNEKVKELLKLGVGIEDINLEKVLKELNFN